MKIWQDDKASNLVLKDGQRFRVPVMLRDNAAPRCDLCNDTNYVEGASILCPICKNKNSGTAAANTAGDRATTLSEADRRVLADAEMRARTAGHRAGWAIDSSPEGKARRQKTFDAMAEADEERENAWRTLSSNVFQENTERLSRMPTPTEMEQIKRNAPQDTRTVSQVAADHAQNMQNVYQEHENFLQNAWRNLR